MSVNLIDQVPELFAQLTKHEYIFESPSLRGDLYTGPAETLEARTAIGALTGLVHGANRAELASQNAVSWRNFNVGASASMCNFKTGRMGFLDGYNVKPKENSSSLNLHAEQIVLRKGRDNGLDRMVGIAVYADAVDDNANPYNTATLRVCGRCVTMFATAPEVDDRTIILGTNLDMSMCELYTFGALKSARLENNALTHDLLVPESFSLQSEEDLEQYDREIKPKLVSTIYNLYSETAS